MASYHEYTLRRRRIRWAHWDDFKTNKLPRIIKREVVPWSELAGPHDFVSDVRDEDDGRIVGLVARPKNYSDIYGNDLYYASLIEEDKDKDEIFVASEWTSDFEREIQVNRDSQGNANTGPNRLMCLSFNIYNEKEGERIERKLQQQRLGIQQTAWFLLFNLAKRALRKPEEEKEAIAQLGSLYNIDFELDGKNLVLDEGLIPGRFRSWLDRYYEIKTEDGEVVAKIRRKAGPIGISATRIVDEYAVEINRRYDNSKPLFYLAVAIADYMHMEDKIRDNCFYEGKDPRTVPKLSEIFRYD